MKQFLFRVEVRAADGNKRAAHVLAAAEDPALAQEEIRRHFMLPGDVKLRATASWDSSRPVQVIVPGTNLFLISR